MSVLIAAKNVTKRYSVSKQGRSEAINNLSFELKAGQVLGLLGHNGAGKSTLIKSLLGAQDYQGKIDIMGYEPQSQRPKVMEYLSYISDVSVLPDWMTVEQVIRYTDGVNPSFNKHKALSVLEGTDIKLGSKIYTLSKGMKVQLHLSIIIATDAKVLILDEPTLGLDLVYRDTFYRHLLEWFQDGERALIIASHEVLEIEHLLTDVLILKQGEVVMQSSMEEIANDYVIVEISDEDSTDLGAIKPLSNERVLGASRLLLRSDQRDLLDNVDKIYNVKLSDMFLALQKGAV